MVDEKTKEFHKAGGYDVSLFDNKSLDEDTLHKNASWIKAAESYYALRHNGQPRPAGMSDEALSQDTLESMSWFNNNIVATGKTALMIKNATPEQQKDFLYLMDVYSHTSTNAAQFLRGAWRGAVDPANIASVGAGVLSLGTGGAAGFAATSAAKVAAMTGIRQVVLQNIAKGAVVGAIDGAVQGALRDTAVQTAEIAGTKQSEYDLGRTAGSTATGAAIGGVFGGGLVGAGHAIVPGIKSGFNKVVQSLQDLPSIPLPKSIDKALKAFSLGFPDPVTATTFHAVPNSRGGANQVSGNIMPPDGKHFFHTLAQTYRLKDPGLWTSNLARWLPNEFYIHKKIRPALHFIDSSVENTGLLEPVNTLNTSMKNLSEQLSQEMIPIDEAKRQVIDAIEDFSIHNKTKIQQVVSDIEILQQELSQQETYSLGDSRGMLGFSKTQKTAFHNELEKLKIRLGHLQDPQYYEKKLNSQSDPKKVAKFIHDDFYTVTCLVNDTRLRLNANYYDTGNLPSKQPVAHVWNKAEEKWEEKAIWIQEVEQLERGIIAGYHNPESTPVPTPIDMMQDNAENLFFSAIGFHKKIKRNEQGKLDYAVPDVGKFADYLEGLYDFGRAADAVQAIKYLQYLRGGAGIDTFPGGFIPNLRTRTNTKANPEHFERWVKRVEAATLEVPHNSEPGAQRETLKTYTETMMPFITARAYPGADRISAPTKNDTYLTEIKQNQWRRWFMYAVGGETIPAPTGADNKKVSMQFNAWFKPKKEGEHFWSRPIERAPSWAKIPYRWAAAPFNTGLYGTQLLLGTTPTHSSNFNLLRSFALSTALTVGGYGAALTALEEGGEWALSEITGKKIDTRLDLGSRMIGGVLSAANLGLAPLRWGVDMENATIKKLTGFDTLATIDPWKPDWVSLDLDKNLGWVNRNILGDRGEIKQTAPTAPTAGISDEDYIAKLEEFMVDVNGHPVKVTNLKHLDGKTPMTMNIIAQLKAEGKAPADINQADIQKIARAFWYEDDKPRREAEFKKTQLKEEAAKQALAAEKLKRAQEELEKARKLEEDIKRKIELLRKKENHSSIADEFNDPVNKKSEKMVQSEEKKDLKLTNNLPLTPIV